MLLNLSDQSPEPLHRQISGQIRARVLSGELAPGEALPSIRGLARDQRVSVITVQRAFDDLERDGLIYSRRGKGFFVAPLTSDNRLERARERARAHLREAIEGALAEGLDHQTVRELIRAILADAGRTAGKETPRAR